MCVHTVFTRRAYFSVSALPPLLSLSHSQTLTLPHPLGSFWIFGKETPTAATDRGAGVLTPGSGSFPIKTHRTQKTFLHTDLAGKHELHSLGRKRADCFPESRPSRCSTPA